MVQACRSYYQLHVFLIFRRDVTKNWWQVEFFQETLHPSLTPASGEFAGFIIHYFHNATRNLLAAPALVIQHQRHCAN